MPRFRFPLDPLIRHRKRVEDQRQQALAALTRQRVEIEGHIRTLHQDLLARKAQLASQLVGPVDTNLIRDHAVAVAWTESEVRRAAVRLSDLYQRLEAARLALLEAVKSRKSLDRFREQRFQAWRQDLLDREAAAIDDLVTSRAARVLQEHQP